MLDKINSLCHGQAKTTLYAIFSLIVSQVITLKESLPGIRYQQYI